MRKIKYILLLIGLGAILYYGATVDRLTNNINGTFIYRSDKGVFFISAMEEKNKFYFYNEPLGIFEEGRCYNTSTGEYTLSGDFIEEQVIHIKKGKFTLHIDQRNYYFDKTSDTPIFPKDLYKDFLENKGDR